MKKIFIVTSIIAIFGFIFIYINSRPTLDEKIAQMIMVGFNGQALDESNPIYTGVKDHKIGGVILFNVNADKNHPEYIKNIDNPDQVKKLISDLQNISDVPLLVSIDQEGGLVSRLNEKFDVSRLSAKQLGDKNDLEFTYSENLKTATTLAELGFNINFAPCVDVAINPESPIAKKQRIYSDNALTVYNHAEQVINAHNDAGIFPVMKHFPGHGSATGDTHDDFVDITNDFDMDELVPYKSAITAGKNMGVMTTHVFNKNIDDKYPLSLSEKSITGLLKKDLDFKGIVFSDDLNMGALANHYSWSDVLILAINSGTDILVIGNNLDYQADIIPKSIEIIKQAVKSGQISKKQIDNSYKKIKQLKKSMNK